MHLQGEKKKYINLSQKASKMKNFKELLKDIKVFIFDVDGVLSSNVMNLNSETGLPIRTGNVKDGYALHLASKLGYKMKSSTGRTTSAAALNTLLKEVHGSKEQNVIEQISLRTMQKARYSTENIGHYGLAFRYYTHFTSPIRRYPDLLVHRLLNRYLTLGARTVSKPKYEDLCEHCSAQEQVAANAERASIKYKQVEFMSEHIGEEFDAVISGVTEWGFYAEINENKCEGMVPMRTLQDDYYEFDDANYCIIGRRRKRKFTIGDPVRVRIVRANLDKKQLDFELIDD